MSLSSVIESVEDPETGAPAHAAASALALLASACDEHDWQAAQGIVAAYGLRVRALFTAQPMDGDGARCLQMEYDALLNLLMARRERARSELQGLAQRGRATLAYGAA